jgi:hypothetical protein
MFDMKPLRKLNAVYLAGVDAQGHSLRADELLLAEARSQAA